MTDGPIAGGRPDDGHAADRHWADWLRWAAEQGVSVPEDAEFHAARARVWAASDFAAVTAVRSPGTLAALLADGALERAPEAGELDRLLAEALAPLFPDSPDEPGLARTLRRFRRTQMLRIVWRDLSGWATLDETLESLSALADACVQRALDLVTAWTEAELGVPRDAEGHRQRLLVLGMGKLGARELNLSSDIDLIFAFPRGGETSGGPRVLSNEQFFTRLGQRLVKALDEVTVDGFVFRVDTRLRPFGSAGPLAMSFDAMEGYYQAQAREWERYAMTKARVIAGPPGPAAELMAELRPFVYRRYLDFGAIESLRSLKVMIARELKRKGMEHNIKLGPGGIREIEFVGQSFQLIRGGREPELRIRAIQPVLKLLGDKGLLSPIDVAALTSAYRFLRLTENRLQAWQDRQTHVLPDKPEARLRLARSMGFDDWAGFAAVLDAHRQRVQRCFEAIFAEPGAGQHPLAGLWIGRPDPAEAESLLAAHGFADPAEAAAAIARFRDAAKRRGLSTRAAEHLDLVVPVLLAAVADSDDPDLALPRVLTVVESVLGRTAYLALLSEHPDALRQLVRLSAKSPWFAERTARQPLLLDELLDPRRLFEPLRRADLERELDVLLDTVGDDDLEQRMERLRQFVQGNKLRTAAADITGVIPLMVVSDYLTEIAEVATSRSLAIAFGDISERHGRPPGAALAEPGFLVLGYGKLGGIELGYNSDLDLVFLYDEALANVGTEPDADGQRPISGAQFYVRLAQRMIHIMTTPTYSGVLYEIDARLRPDGDKGMIARTLASFDSYQREEAWTWEHQALVRARPVAGDRRLAERFRKIRAAILRLPREPGKLRADVRDMRDKMRASLDKTRDDRFDLKQGRGGIADIEFIVQYSVLRWAAEHPELTDWTDNVRLLQTLDHLALLPGHAAGELTEAYKALRTAYHRNALQDTPGVVPDTELVAERDAVAGLWRRLIEAGSA
ncbi:MAG: bifunctional [glutamate--ammonia ligase]-adenylyl-L-tyrosine phosphorylase/[glutamate--ammonia-ligase] adenylyltransferase [Thiohalocapsa sp.]|uniref:bifunctional [glutamate--ammonia ligase]-adenylyl-L-tyrosine phosphorylase/[glutamate--ammonia-ligase] adenylyltransferase n=1 Tax=Thiohalocapsa sp. TaxID=2497641 RepID=UPI0025FFF079|nr:bifunctional [glutamate--ammonia ligase]-adenylyl-L-tyrosine phosphorylase/[glutamate--ammonia-ligase] adenylyltransferase [Thiohalocapsa sp.]MCG6943401.1 bifunctional [glutamate--ammonia ligase]-adenylyl-L-tyrosine phosphorylase/[glutamate--ammonia-ligase] adenylyltransferase [Thiohalocapsa sp.]